MIRLPLTHVNTAIILFWQQRSRAVPIILLVGKSDLLALKKVEDIVIIAVLSIMENRYLA